MSKINTERLIQHLQEKWEAQPCPMCGARQWNVQDKSFELREFHSGDFVVGSSSVIPVIPVICSDCGNTILVNSLIADVENDKGDINE